ncbi:hypothetical protein TthAA37_09530 [Thermus thermophilus]|uniref:Uncharacterized protein n=1 Tax=Thermus thermophilus TaxID=274 RepID=A0AAD1NY70_THETH|nr:hypothetical protein [Thermus thermophilus]BCZ86755.1 hypothetical protein TthAA11_09370 [Thermus thermophilus]BCZ89133.1 hypothetical protein TthAA22_09380 [Thermus thermophilus]BCZ91764.1 hypothetical protein TthAA37_09530 [Thermus thermophilus]BCZ94307.1 hypothetical protein TthAK1_09240 [Thermus thermophilus]
MEHDMLTTTEVAARLGITERRAQQLARELRARGFRLEEGRYGGFAWPAGLVELVREVREAGQGLEALSLDPRATPFRARPEPEALALEVGDALYTLWGVRRVLGTLARVPYPRWPGEWRDEFSREAV